VVFESLDCRRRTDAKRGDEAKRLADCVWRRCQNGADKDCGWPVYRSTQNSGMGHGADRTLVTGKLGIVSVNVNRLDDADEGDEQNT
jgi:hypothetical protein